jgi:hypothetical protein
MWDSKIFYKTFTKMLKIEKIISIEPYEIVSKFNNGETKKLNILPIIQNHIEFDGVEKLLDEKIFKTAKLGVFTEIYWKKIVKTSKNEIWNYDISPEYFYENGIEIND